MTDYPMRSLRGLILLLIFLFKTPIMKKPLLLVALILLFSQSTVFAQSANDNLCDALAIEIGATCTEVPNLDNRAATAETNEPEVFIY